MMDELAENPRDYSASPMIEGIAHVVAVKGAHAWLEPEQTGSCGGCAASGACGAKGIGTVANRLEARRFIILNEHGLTNGERVVVGIRQHALLQASLAAYALPLASMFGCGILAQWSLGRDGATLAAMVAGLVLGFGLMRLRAQHLQAKGVLSPRYLRRARPNETCHTD